MIYKKRDFRFRTLISTITYCGVLSLMAVSQSAYAQFVAGGIVVSQIGTGTTTVSGTSYAEFLQEFSLSSISQTTPIYSVALPTADSGSNHALTDSTSATSDGYIKLSTNGQYLTIQGYDAPPSTGSVASTSGIARVVGLVNAFGNVDTSTFFSDGYNTNNIRSSILDNSSNTIYTGGTSNASGGVTNGGVRSIPVDGTSSTNYEDTLDNVRNVAIFNGTVYFSSGSGSNKGINYFNGTSAINLVADAAGSPYDFYFANANTVYIADDSSVTGTNKGGLQKYTSTDGVTFTLAYTDTGAGPLRGLTGITDGNGNVTLYATTTAATANSLVSVTDVIANTTPPATQPTFTTVATAPVNTVFRGVALAPVAAPEPSSILAMFIGAGALGVLITHRRVGMKTPA